MRLRTVFAIILITTASSALAAADESAKVRELLAKKVQPGEPGAVVTVLNDGKIIYQGEFGLANVDEKLPLKPDTVFDLASCSKQFTAMAVMILAEQGKLSFDDDARKYLPELKEHEQPLRLRHLLTMTSGLPDYMTVMDTLEGKSNTDVLHAVAHKPAMAPGAKYDYSNTNFVLLALIVERVSKERFPRFMAENVFKPAGMTATLVLEKPGQAVKLRALGYRKTKKGIEKVRDDTSIYGDGQVMTSSIDMAAWDRALRENKLVKPATFAQAITSGKLNDGKPCGYGFGWSISREGGHKLAWHEGEWTGTNSYIVRSLDDGLTVIVLSNVQNFNAGKVGDEISAIFRKAQKP